MRSLVAALCAALASASPAPADSPPTMPMECVGQWESPRPRGLAFDLDGTIYVANGEAGTVSHFTADGSLLCTWSGADQVPPFYSLPLDVDTDVEGFVYVSDYSLHRVEKYDACGHLLATFGRPFLNWPSGLAVDRRTGRVAVISQSSSTTREVLVFSSGSLLWVFSVDRYAAGLAIDGEGNIYVAAVFGTVEKRDEWGHPLGAWTVPDGSPQSRLTSLAISPNGRIHVVDRGDGRVYVLDPDLQLAGQWDLSCLGPTICDFSGGIPQAILRGVAIDGQGNTVLGMDCPTRNIALFRPTPTVPARTTTWGRLKTLYR